MDTQLIKKLILSGSFVLFSAFIFGQKAPFIIVSDIVKKCFYPGDTLSFTIKNTTPKSRGYTIEAVCVDINSKFPIFSSEMYTAYFNNDTLFFKEIMKSKKIAFENKIGFIPPDYRLTPYGINADSLSTFLFIIKGNRMNNGVKIKFRITPDLVDGEPDFLIETKPFFIFTKAM